LFNLLIKQILTKKIKPPLWKPKSLLPTVNITMTLPAAKKIFFLDGNTYNYLSLQPQKQGAKHVFAGP
jgi:hypothetical protein